MSNTIRLKRASGSDPGASDLVTGELAIRTDTGKLFTKKDDNSVAEIGAGLSDGDKGDITVSNSGATFTIDTSVIANGNIASDAAIARTKLANVDVVDDTSPQLGGDLDTNSHEILLDDNHAVKFGDDVDLTVLHSGSTGVINNLTGDLHIKTTSSGDDIALISNDDIELQVAGGEDGIKVIGDGAVELYHNGNKKFETKSGGIAINGYATFPDGSQAIFGASSDMEIYHIADNTNVIRGPGKLTIQSDDTTSGIKLSSYSGGETFAEFKKNGSVDLYHDNSLRFSTSAAGAEVHGDLQIDDNNKIKFGNGGDLEIFHDGSQSHIKDVGTGNLNIASNTTAILNAASNTNIAVFKEGAEVELYHNGTKMFETTSSGIKLAKNCQAPLSTLTDGSTITVDFAVASHFTVTLGGNRTFGDPSNLSGSVGSSGSIFIVQDGTGSRTASFHSDYKFVGGTAPTLSTAANAVDRIDYVIKDSSTVHCAVSLDVK